MADSLLPLVLLSLFVYLPHNLSQPATLSDDSCAETTRKTLKLLTILPHRGVFSLPTLDPSWNQSMMDVLISKLDLLVEEINNDSVLLPCHKLELVYKKGGCNDRLMTTLESLASGLFPQDKSEVVGILGSRCSLSAVETVKLANRPEVQLVVVHNGGSLMLEKYENAIGMLGSSRVLIDLSLFLIKKNEWNNIGILYEGNHPYYHEMKNEFLIKLTEKPNVNAKIVSPVYSFFYPLNEIRSSRVRIVLIFVSLKHLRRILCLAYHMGLMYPAYQWVILSHTLSDIVTQNVSFEHSFTFRYKKLTYTCTDVDLIHALEKAFIVSFLLYAKNTQANTYVHELSNKEFLWDTQSNLIYSFSDALYAWVRVLHSLTINSPDIEFKYANNSLVETITEQFFKLTFEGTTGRISFNSSTGFANRPANLYQIINGQEISIGSLNSSKISVLTSFSHISDQFRNVALPHKGVTGFFIAAQFVELLIVIILHILTFVYRKAKSVKATSPKLVHLAFIGGYIFIATLTIWSISFTADFGPKTDASLCQIIWGWGLPLSFTLTLGIVTMRTWRLYRIFIHYRDPGKFLSNPALTLAVFLLASVDVAIATIWTVVDPMKLIYREIMVKIGSQYEVFLDRKCFYNLVWLVLVFLFKITLLVALIVLTVLTRKIPNSTFTTDSLKFFAYSFTITSVLGFGIYYLLIITLQYPDPHAEFITLSSLLNMQLVLFVTFIITPPLIPILLQKIKHKKIL